MAVFETAVGERAAKLCLGPSL